MKNYIGWISLLTRLKKSIVLFHTRIFWYRLFRLQHVALIITDSSLQILRRLILGDMAAIASFIAHACGFSFAGLISLIYYRELIKGGA